MMWSSQLNKVYNWETIDELLKMSKPHPFFEDRFQKFNRLLQFVRFPLLPLATLKKVNQSRFIIIC